MQWLFRLIALAGSILLCALALEGVLRVAVGPPVIFQFPQERYQPDPEMGFAMVPNQEAFTHSRAVQTNSLGLRDSEYPAEAPPNTLRILALGDSQTFGNGIDLEASWPKQLERKLSVTAPEKTWQVINGGVSGTSPWQHKVLFERVLDRQTMDAVVLAVYVNDVEPKPAELSMKHASTNSGSKRLVYLLKRSALVTAAVKVYHAQSAKRNPRPEGDWERNIITGAPDSAVERGWVEVDRAVGDIQRRAAARGIPFVILVLSRQDQVDGSLPATSFNEKVAEIAKSNGVAALIDPLGAMQKAYETAGQALFIPWDGHNTAIANEVIAEALAAPMITLLPSANRDS